MGTSNLNLEAKEAICAVYARVSIERNSESVEHQVSLLREFVKQKEIGIIPDEFIYEDVGVSASKYSIWSRPAMKQLMKDADEGKFSILLFKGISRLARDTKEALEILERFKQKGIRVISFEENYDSAREDSKFIFGIHALLAEQESEKIGIRIKLGLKEKAKKGEWSGSPPFGYKVQDKKLVVNPEEAEIVRKIFKMYVEDHVGTAKLSDHLNDHGFRTRSGRPFSRKTVGDILKNEVYLGRIIYNRNSLKKIRDYESEDQRKKLVRLPNNQDEWIVVENCHEPLVDEKTFEEAQKLLNARRTKRESSNIVYPLSGIMKCKKCGRSMVGRRFDIKGKEYRYYICDTYNKFGRSFCDQPNVSAKPLEEYILELLTEKLKTVQDQIELGKNLELMETNKKEIEKKLKQIDAQIEKVNRDTSDLYFERENMEETQYQFILQRLQEKAKQLNEEKDQLLTQLQLSSESEEQQAEIRKHIDEFFNLDQSNYNRVRKVLHHFIDKIEIEDKHLNVHYKFSF